MGLNQQIVSLSEQNHTLHGLWAKKCIDSAFFIAQTNELEQKILKLRMELQRYRTGSNYAGMITKPSGCFHWYLRYRNTLIRKFSRK